MWDQIIPFEWERIFWGEAPPFYLLEILFRVAVIWPWTHFLLRWIGGRSISQLSLAEFLLVIALGSAVGDALFLPDVPLIPAMLVILAVVLIDKAIDVTIRQWVAAKQVFDGKPIEVLRDGRLLGQGMAVNQISSAEIMEMLRLRGVENLGSLERAYIEPSGQISAFPADPPRMGLPIVPPPELMEQESDRETEGGAGAMVCCSCGTAVPEPDQACPNCAGTHALPAKQAKPWSA